MSESIIHNLWRDRRHDLLRIGGRGPVDGEVNDERAGDDLLTGYEAPEAGISAVVAIIAHDKVEVRRNQQLAVLNEALHLMPPLGIDSWIGRIGADGGKVIAVWRAGGGLECDVGFVDFLAVNEELALNDADAVAGNSDDALDEVSGLGVMEDDDVAALDVAIGKDPTGEFSGGGVNLLVHQEKVADEKGSLHAFRWNEERLKDKGEKKESDDDGF